MCDSHGANPVQMTFFGGPLTGTPRWSPDGRQIAFASYGNRPHEPTGIYLIAAEGGSPRRLTTDPSDHTAPSWSRDGRWIYFGSDRSGTYQVWKVPAVGGEAIQVTKKGGVTAFESPDGGYLYYARIDSPGIWRVPLKGGEETLVLGLLQPAQWGSWAVVNTGIYFVNALATPHAAIEFFSFATRRVTRIAMFEKEPDAWDAGLAISPDGRWILYCQVDYESVDLMLVENFY